MVAGPPRNCLMPMHSEQLQGGESLASGSFSATLRHVGSPEPGRTESAARLSSVDLPSEGCSVCETTCPLLNTLHDLAEWFQDAGGDYETVLRADEPLEAEGLSAAAARLSVTAVNGNATRRRWGNLGNVVPT